MGNNQEKKSIINQFKKDFIDCMSDIDPKKYMKIVDKNFWDSLLDDCSEHSGEIIGQRKFKRIN